MVQAFIGGGTDRAAPVTLDLAFANRHGLIAGATGTGKTVTLQILAESFSNAGVPVFLADVKGDLSGLAKAGSHTHKLHEKLVARADRIGFDDYGYDPFPVVFWDLFGTQGHPVRTTVTEMGPLLLSRMLDLNDVQEGVLNVCFALADDEGLLLLDLKDLRAVLNYVGDNASDISTEYGYVTKASVGAIQRRLLVLENQGGEALFGEPALDLKHMMMTAPDGRGQVNVLAADQLMQSPKLYATFLLWLLSELFEELPEVGDPDKPKFVFFFDEAHLLFDDAPKALIDKVEMVARLIRSKGVGVYFCTQNPADVPDDILGQLGGRFQHALRAYTPRDRKALRAAAETFRPNPAFDAEKVIPELGTGEALVSTLGEGGVPSVVERTLVRPPSSQLGPLTKEERAGVVNASPLSGHYEQEIDRESAYEVLNGTVEQAVPVDIDDGSGARGTGGTFTWNDFKQEQRRGAIPTIGGYQGDPEPPRQRDFRNARRYTREDHTPPKKTRRKAARRTDSVGEAMIKSFARSASSRLGREIVRGVLGGLFRGR